MTVAPPVRIEFLGIDFDQIDEMSAIELCLRLAHERRFTYVATPNVDHIVRLHEATPPAAQELKRAYLGAALRLCDSRILQLLASWSQVNLTLVAGSDLTSSLLREPRLAGMRIALIGAESDAHAWFVRTRPDVGFSQNIPPMGVATNSAAQDAIVEFVERADANIVLFALGAPQSELLCQKIADRGLARGVGLCIGASIEFLSGAKRRAPLWVRRLRLEWAFRLASEPRRLWRRYLIEGPRIFGIWREWKRQSRA
ncbi:WecB/TagA/CpsF family glycosyltransferase [Novosphingobium sp. Gsoil 351]|uniref:WecB/TagA/CpsF family glycosyltransferase n=1 Tax=Novosphingobium sp. Gsoil 351 TaxID=2675225 RepID=UPI0012B49C92|nr:WecB/TagA/CpsF family glycosyltransferase [Novosphingobium sp. Gsoil 351]QGN56089.1 WecB/TagA/CpsF family glycosyltransferase [Novosphingobium sp. Gsoil 351]